MSQSLEAIEYFYTDAFKCIGFFALAPVTMTYKGMASYARGSENLHVRKYNAVVAGITACLLLPITLPITLITSLLAAFAAAVLILTAPFALANAAINDFQMSHYDYLPLVGGEC